MNRRQFIQSLLALAAASALPGATASAAFPVFTVRDCILKAGMDGAISWDQVNVLLHQWEAADDRLRRTLCEQTGLRP